MENTHLVFYPEASEFSKNPSLLFAFIKHDMYFCPNKDNAVFIYKTNKSGIKFLNKT